MEEENAWFDELSYENCMGLLRQGVVGRIAVVVDQFPVVLPISYRLLESRGQTWIAIRTRPGNVLDRASMHVALEIDGIDPTHRQWSVLVRGSLYHVDPDAADFLERFAPEPWMTTEREAWLVIQTFSITGRQLHYGEREWAFHPTGYP